MPDCCWTGPTIECWRRTSDSASGTRSPREPRERLCRTSVFGLRQLTDATVRALSPGINDPTTAVHARDQTTALLCDLARYRLGDRALGDDDGVVRVVLRRPTLADLLDEALTQPRRYGSPDPAVLTALLRMLRAVQWSVTRPEDTAAVASQLALLVAAVDAEDVDPAQRASLLALARSVRLGGPPHPRADRGQPGWPRTHTD